jgi:hypothetical protein
MEVSDQFHAPVALPPGSHRNQLDRRRDGLEAVAKRKIPSPRRESNPKTPIVQPVA